MRPSFLILAAFLAGCTTGPMPELAPGDIPGAWEQVAANDAPVWPARDWWTGFESPELDALIASVEAGNLDLAAAEQRILQADARVRQAGSSLLPDLGIGIGGSRSGDAGDPSSFGDSFDARFSASYEVDFWGANRAGVTAAEADRVATHAERATVALTAVAGAANTYFELLSLRERLAVAQLNLDIARSVLNVTESRVRNGVSTPLELSQQLGTIAGQEAAIPNLEQQILETRAALALLAGRPVEGFDIGGESLDAIATPEVQPGLPSELLTRRPDIASAEAGLVAAHADLQAARAALFPSISLSAGGGVGSDVLAGLLDGPLGLSIGLDLAQTIFDAGARAAGREAAAAREMEVLAGYRSTVLTAFADVEIALGQIANLRREEVFRRTEAEQAQRSFDIVSARYREGVADYLELLDAQRTLYDSRDSLSEIKLARLQAVVGLFQALGGGWERETALAALPGP
jgi:multidrug efflux system outer membrane protein